MNSFALAALRFEHGAGIAARGHAFGKKPQVMRWPPGRYRFNLRNGQDGDARIGPPQKGRRADIGAGMFHPRDHHDRATGFCQRQQA